MKAVRFDQYGPVGVLDVREVPIPEPGPGQVLVRVNAAGINPGEAKIRDGLLHALWPATFPSGQGSDFAGVVDRVGPGVQDVAAGDRVIGYVHSTNIDESAVIGQAANRAMHRCANLDFGVATLFARAFLFFGNHASVDDQVFLCLVELGNPAADLLFHQLSDLGGVTRSAA